MTDLLGIARIEGGQLAPKLETIDLVDMVGAACSGLPSPPQVSLTRRIPVDLPFVLAEPVMLQQMIANLADNAFRHALSEVVIAASVAGERVLLSVSDDGPGIPEDRREAVFDRFVRLAGSDRSSGSGLGLAIVRGFADAMGMTVALGASPSGGSCFTLAMAAVALPKESEA
jgi:two-component system sensor histidine kinase KdpD